MVPSPKLDILFILNPKSGGSRKTNWEKVIRDYFKSLPYHIEIFILTGKDDALQIQGQLKKITPEKIVAVGGDGTVSLVAKLLLHTSIPMGILRGGSANAMATDLKIPENNSDAIETILKGRIQKCDAIKINEKDISIHLSDLGLNARIVKYFHQSSTHGMWGYARFFIKILLQAKHFQTKILADNKEVTVKAFMIVIANAKKYGTGAIINPKGIINDGKFEIVAVRKISISEIFKMFSTTKGFNPKNVEIFQTSKALISTKRKIDFQIDGEYIGKTNNVSAQIIPSALNIIVPLEYDDEESQG